jgi:CheY-like chemotaxis protein
MIIEDEAGIQRLLERVVALLGHEATSVTSGTDALREAQRSKPDLIIADMSLQGELGGIKLVRALRALDSACPIIVTTGYTSEDLRAEIEAEGIHHVLTKPFDVGSARRLIAALIGKPRTS